MAIDGGNPAAELGCIAKGSRFTELIRQDLYRRGTMAAVVEARPSAVQENSAGIDENPLSPPLKWAGGKRWLLPQLRPKWEMFSDHRLVEPFAGGLAVALGFRPKRALLNDINPHVVNFYRWLKKGLTIDLEMRRDERLYYKHRKEFNRLVHAGGSNSKEAAELFYFLNRSCYNGLCRFNQDGGFNVPYGRYPRAEYKRDFSEYKEALANWEFTCGDFQDLDLQHDDFVYADPPYDVEFTQYAKEGFDEHDQERLAKWLSSHTGPVIISNQATPKMKQLYRRWKFSVDLRHAPRLISCDGNRTRAWEVLASRNLAIRRRAATIATP
jgi:DNA adenine methylase